MSRKAKILFLLISILALFLRLKNIEKNFFLHNDSALAFLIVDRILNTNHVLMVGQTLSLSGVNILPPIFYYFMTILFFILKSEFLVSLVFTFIGICAVYLVFLFCKEIVNIKTALTTMLLFAVSNEMVKYGRILWEPYLLPFFNLLSFYFLFLGLKKKSVKYILISIIIFIFSFLYISTFLLIPSYILAIYYVCKSLKLRRKTVIIFLFFLLTVVLAYLPVFIFEWQHNFYSWQMLTKSDRISFSISEFITSKISSIVIFFNSIFLFNFNKFINFFIYSFVIVGIIIYYLLYSFKNKLFFIFVILPFLSSTFFLGIYKGIIYPYRLASLYPFFFIILSDLICRFYKDIKAKNTQKLITNTNPLLFIIIVYFIYLNSILIYQQIYPKSGYRIETEKIVSYIAERSRNITFSLFVISPLDSINNDSYEYWYGLEKLLGKRFLKLNSYGNYFDLSLNVNSEKIFLICRGFICLDPFMKKYKLEDPIEKIKIGNENIYTFRGFL